MSESNKTVGGTNANAAMSDTQKSVRKTMSRRKSSASNTLSRLEIKNEQLKMKVRNIGRGAFGDVHKASWNGVDVAIKQLTKIDDETMRAFRAEVLLMSQLRHPNIITLMGALWTEKMVGIVLEFASGGALDDALKSTKISADWTWKDPKLRIITDIARGMNYLHNTTYFDEKLNQQVTSVIHRDLKPGNVLLTNSFTAKVADFGASRAMTATSSEMTMAGTPIYMAPEVVLGESYNSSADVYSFGVLMFALTCEMGNAHKAFQKAVEKERLPDQEESEIASEQQLISEIVKLEIRPELRKAEMARELAKLIRKCWMERAQRRLTVSERSERTLWKTRIRATLPN